MESIQDDIQPETNSIDTTKPIPTKKKHLKKIICILVIIVLIAGSGAAGYYLRDQSAKSDNSKNEATISNLTKSSDSLKKQLSAAENATSNESDLAIVPSTKCTSTANNNVSSSIIENVKASITSGNTAALEGYMASTVCFSLATSDGIGNMTASKAVETLTGYLPNNDTWTFSPTASELASYKAGQYSKYFVDGAIIGKSSIGRMLIISFNTQGKINVILWSSTQSELMN